MSFNIFVNDKGIIKIYKVNIDEQNFKKIQNDIDSWNGKGELLSETASIFGLLEKYDSQNTKIQIISSKPIGKETIICDGFKMENVDVYKLTYYAYNQCDLSKLCDDILANKTIIKKSIYLNNLLNWSSNKKKELLFVKLLLKYVTIEPLNINVKFNNNLTNLFKNLLDMNTTYQLYQTELEKQISAQQHNNPSLKAQKMKKKIFESLPQANKIGKGK